MIIGPLTIRWTKDIKAEQAAFRAAVEAKHDKAKVISAKIVERLLHDNRQYKAALHRWGVSEGVIKGKERIVRPIATKRTESVTDVNGHTETWTMGDIKDKEGK